LKFSNTSFSRTILLSLRSGFQPLLEFMASFSFLRSFLSFLPTLKVRLSSFSLYSISFLLLCSLTSYAIEAKEKLAVNISAKEGIEIDDIQRTIEGHQDIVVIRGTQKLYADHVRARFEKENHKKPRIQHLEVWGRVVLQDADGQIQADKAIYDVAKDTILLTGQLITFEGKDFKINAHGRLFYFPKAKKARAIGKVKIEKGEQTLVADEVTAYFEEDPALPTASLSISPSSKLKKMEAKGNVKIIFPDQVAFANYGEHDEVQGTTYLEGNVELSTAQGQIQGGYAEMASQGVSRVLQHKPSYGKASDTTRVEALILRT